MSKKSSTNFETPSTGTAPPEQTLTTDELIARLRAQYPPREFVAPDWYMTMSQFMEFVTDVVCSLPWTDDKRPGHPEDLSVTVSMAVDTINATINTLQSRGVLKWKERA